MLMSPTFAITAFFSIEPIWTLATCQLSKIPYLNKYEEVKPISQGSNEPKRCSACPAINVTDMTFMSCFLLTLTCHHPFLGFLIKVSQYDFSFSKRYFEDVKMQALCADLGNKFNQRGTPKPIQFLPAWVLESPKINDVYCGLEPFIGNLTLSPLLQILEFFSR